MLRTPHTEQGSSLARHCNAWRRHTPHVVACLMQPWQLRCQRIASAVSTCSGSALSRVGPVESACAAFWHLECRQSLAHWGQGLLVGAAAAAAAPSPRTSELRVHKPNWGVRSAYLTGIGPRHLGGASASSPEQRMGMPAVAACLHALGGRLLLHCLQQHALHGVDHYSQGSRCARRACDVTWHFRHSMLAASLFEPRQTCALLSTGHHRLIWRSAGTVVLARCLATELPGDSSSSSL